METVIKQFHELTLHELYEILRLRAQVFVVEQNCVYQDLDGKDYKAWHILGYRQNQIVAYTRIFAAGDYYENAAIGRVVVDESVRKLKLGQQIMEVSIAAIREFFDATSTIQISAQSHLKKFYNQLGFKHVGPEYLEDGIPHIQMINAFCKSD
ncbi:MAG: hypothetical protein RLZZ241_2504 [Bacteroidota bacterium]|jgi:ElaA protein